ncbi:MAG TPA: hypothetical protein VFX16_01135, partial [Pseudonocardiaceae bacterium]|nr:hypothetical protein [Pseudonocardiaceae bacterium]
RQRGGLPPGSLPGRVRYVRTDPPWVQSPLVSYGWRRQDGVMTEICDECGFDSRRVVDVVAGLRAVLTAMHCLLTDPDVDQRPAPETWSATEYVEHSLFVVRETAEEVAVAAGQAVATPPTDCMGALAIVDALVAGPAGRRLDELMLDTPFATISARDNLPHALHDLEHHLLDIRRGYSRIALTRGDDLHTTAR